MYIFCTAVTEENNSVIIEIFICFQKYCNSRLNLMTQFFYSIEFLNFRYVVTDTVFKYNLAIKVRK